MKKILSFILALILCASLFTLSAFAEDDTTVTDPVTDPAQGETAPEEAPDTVVDGEEPAPDVDDTATDAPTDIPAEPEISTPDEQEKFYDELLDFVTNGANWAKIGGVVLAIVAAVGAIVAKLDKFKGILDALLGFVKGKATKEETEKIVGDGMAELKKEYDEKYSALLEKYNAQAERENEITAVLTVVALQLVKSPYARTEIMGLLSGTKAVAGGVKEIVEAVEEEIEKAEAAEEKTPTPALDSILASTDTEGEGGGNINMGW